MRQLGIWCPCFFILIIPAPGLTGEIVKYSIYDEFGAVVSGDNSRKLKSINEDEFRVLKLDTFDRFDTDISKWRYRTDRYNVKKKMSKNSPYRQSWLPPKRASYPTSGAWKFRPNDEDKKQVIIIDTEAVVPITKIQQRPNIVVPMMMPKIYYPVLPY